MSVYVDELREYTADSIKPAARRFGNRWVHLTADSEDELHRFADQLGLKRSWYQVGGRRHYHWYLSHRNLGVDTPGLIRGRKRRHPSHCVRRGFVLYLTL